MFTNLDYIFLIVSAFFILSSVFKGFIKELTSLMELIIAVLISYYLGGYVKDFILQYINFEFMVATVSFGLTFLIALFATQKLLNAVSYKIQMDSRVDAVLGVVFGIFKSFVVIAIFLAVIDSLINVQNQPDFIKKSYVKGRFYEIKNALFNDDDSKNMK